MKPDIISKLENLTKAISENYGSPLAFKMVMDDWDRLNEVLDYACKHPDPRKVFIFKSEEMDLICYPFLEVVFSAKEGDEMVGISGNVNNVKKMVDMLLPFAGVGPETEAEYIATLWEPVKSAPGLEAPGQNRQQPKPSETPV